MTADFTKQGNAYVLLNDDEEMIAEITYQDKGDYVVADHTFVDPSLRGQGMAEKLLDHLVAEMAKEDKKIKALCPYVVDKFAKEPEKYDAINYDKN
ncbi:GNAT family N-acetyltransferase [Aerococcus kribbianus]|uniref:GNAT family N-acetyltransferase n=1 Tax=Aerococcus kribbianus TaxID=2999064 RepID=A0A9X3JDY4_9LACT|nr:MULTISPECIES: GNAT family N-acetyltransferase [unclassified Aerococcus]MCZ0717996.1 GNAT family N-acetyltransferase [Aerococcus sp. YH-aer221]MCZ0726283.1 GNAT family N-acetyltransferase [Aerococcus sp. YH-aer222]